MGRSNVGKSSLINALVGESIARTSAAPGKTRLANYYLVHSPRSRASVRQTSARHTGDFYLVDLPGYGYARGGREAAGAFETLTTHYFSPSFRPGRTLAGVLHLIDSRHPDLESDAAAHEWLLRADIPLAVVATKIDKLSQSQRAIAMASLKDQFDTAVLPVSAPVGTGLAEIWKVIHEWAGESGL